MTSLCQIAVKWIYWLIRQDLNLIQKIFDNKSGNYAFVNRSRMMSHLSLWVDWQTIREDCICKTSTLLFSHLKASAPCSGMPIQTISPHFLFFWQNVGLLLIQLAVQESGSNKHHRASLSAYPGKASAYPRTEEINTSGCSSLKKHSGGGRGERGRQQGQNSSTPPRTGTDVRVQLCTHLALRVALQRESKVQTLSSSELMKHDLLQLHFSTI